jgi:putative drug exporter of the RND superfamily
MAHSRTTASLARWSATHPWRALVTWLLFIAAALAIGSVVSTKQTSDADFRLGQSGQADAWIQGSHLGSPPTEDVMITSASGSISRSDAEQAAGEVSRRMSAIGSIHHVADPIWSADSQSLLVSVRLVKPAGDADPDVTSLQAVTAAVQAAHRELSVAEVGEASINAAVNQCVSDDLGKAERLSLPITLIIMLIAFGALIAAGIPVLLAISGVVATIALYAPLSHLIPADGTMSSMVLLIGMAVGVDYSLFYLKREREERERGRSTIDAVGIAAATSGHSIVVSGAAVIVAMAGLYVVQDATFSSLATGAILVVAISVIGSLTVLPALLSKLGRWVDRPRVPLLWRLNRRIGRGGISRRVLAPVMRHPKTSLLASSLVVLGLAAPVLGMHLHEGNLATLPQDIPSVQTMKQLDAAFPSEGEAILVVVKTTPAELSAAVDSLKSLSSAAGGRPGIAPGGVVTTSHDRTVALLTLGTTHPEGSAANGNAVTLVRGSLAPRYLDAVPASSWAVGGGAAQNLDYTHNQTTKLPWVIGFVLLLTLLMMGFTFRSVPIAILTTALNLASVAASFGVLTLVFQHTWAQGLLGFTSSGFVVDWIPLFMFVVLIGLSMDYHVFVLSRIREGIDRGLPPRVAVEVGVSETAGVVTSAAAVMVSVFAIFATLSMLELKQMGVGLAISVLVDATLVRVVMLPSLLVLMGRWAWWPSATPRRVRLVPVTDPLPQPATVPAPVLVGVQDSQPG